MPKTVVVSGANGGIGLAISKELAARGTRVVMACRNLEKAERAREELTAGQPDAEVTIVSLDLASLDAVRECAAEIGAKFPAVDGLINNAGVCPLAQQFTADGYELQFGTNYLGPFLLTHLLLPALTKAAVEAGDARILHMSSIIHLAGRIDPDTFRGRKPYLFISAYGQSKLADAMFSGALSRRLPAGLESNAMHPGGVDTGIYADTPAPILKIMRLVLKSADTAAKLAADLIQSDKYRGKSGLFLSAQQPFRVSGTARNAAAQDDLYRRTCELLGIDELARHH